MLKRRNNIGRFLGVTHSTTIVVRIRIRIPDIPYQAIRPNMTIYTNFFPQLLHET